MRKLLSVITLLLITSQSFSNSTIVKEEDCYVATGHVLCSDGTGSIYSTTCQSSPEAAYDMMFDLVWDICPNDIWPDVFYAEIKIVP